MNCCRVQQRQFCNHTFCTFCIFWSIVTFSLKFAPYLSLTRYYFSSLNIMTKKKYLLVFHIFSSLFGHRANFCLFSLLKIFMLSYISHHGFINISKFNNLLLLKIFFDIQKSFQLCTTFLLHKF